MTLGVFSAIFWSLASVILLMIIFEDKLLALEDRFDEWLENKKHK